MKFWMIFSFYLLGVLSGVFIWEKVDFKTIYKGNFKMKQRGKGNTQKSDLEIKTPVQTKREANKADRIRKRNDKKKAKDLKKLEKTS